MGIDLYNLLIRNVYLEYNYNIDIKFLVRWILCHNKWEMKLIK